MFNEKIEEGIRPFFYDFTKEISVIFLILCAGLITKKTENKSYFREDRFEQRVLAEADSSDALNDVELQPVVGERSRHVADGFDGDDGESDDGVVKWKPPAEDRNQEDEAEGLARVHERAEVPVVVWSGNILEFCKNLNIFYTKSRSHLLWLEIFVSSKLM